MQVYDRLQKLYLCLSHSKTIQLVDQLGEDYDEVARQWKQIADEKLKEFKVAIACMLEP